MKKTLFLIASLVLSGCATQSSNSFQSFQAKDLNRLVRSGHLKQKKQSFFILNDSSSSMSSLYSGTGFSSLSKLSVEKELLNRMNQTIPNIRLTSGLRSFGFGSCLSWGFSKLNQATQSYSTHSFSNAIRSLRCSSGGTNVTSSFTAASTDLSSAPGTIALILLSDGHNYDNSPIAQAYALKQQYGNKLCIYTIWVGNKKEESGQAVLREISNISGCGFSTTVAAISSSRGMSDYVKKVFFTSITPVTPIVSNYTISQESDSDGDGVLDNRDRCPNTPRGAIVDKDGCWSFRGVLFDVNKANIKAGFENTFDNATKVLRLNPSLTVEIQGHTDSQGSAQYNQNLSERRANSVKYLLIKNGIDASRLVTIGFGEAEPVSDNHTRAGRANNRRVVFKRTDK